MLTVCADGLSPGESQLFTSYFRGIIRPSFITYSPPFLILEKLNSSFGLLRRRFIRSDDPNVSILRGDVLLVGLVDHGTFNYHIVLMVIFGTYLSVTVGDTLNFAVTFIPSVVHFLTVKSTVV